MMRLDEIINPGIKQFRLNPFVRIFKRVLNDSFDKYRKNPLH